MCISDRKCRVVTDEASVAVTAVSSTMSDWVLVTGGAGYVGSHCLVELLQAGYRVAVLDNLSQSGTAALARVERITGQQVSCPPAAVEYSLYLAGPPPHGRPDRPPGCGGGEREAADPLH